MRTEEPSPVVAYDVSAGRFRLIPDKSTWKLMTDCETSAVSSTDVTIPSASGRRALATDYPIDNGGRAGHHCPHANTFDGDGGSGHDDVMHGHGGRPVRAVIVSDQRPVRVRDLQSRPG